MNTVNITSRKTRTINLPSFKGSEIEIKQFLTVGEIEKVNQEAEKIKAEDKNKSRGIAMFKESIIKWNLAGEDGEVLPIEESTFKLLPMVDYLFLTQEISGSKLLDENNNILSNESVEEEAKKKE